MENIFSQVFTASLFGSSLGFFAAIAVLIIVCFASEVNENGFYAFGCFVLFCVLMHYKGSGIIPAFHFLKSHVWMAWLYLGVGVVHATTRFFYEGYRIGMLFTEFRPEWKKANSIDLGTKLTLEQEEKFRKWVIDGDGNKSQSFLSLLFSSEKTTTYKGNRKIMHFSTNAFRWWFNWPISLVYWGFTEFFEASWLILWNNTKKFFMSFYNAGINLSGKER
ncbi:MAG: hypothetical protein WCG20_02610 [bacterium]